MFETFLEDQLSAEQKPIADKIAGIDFVETLHCNVSTYPHKLPLMIFIP
jgi:hypothetical protein